MKEGQKERKEGGRGKRGANRRIKVNGWKRENQLYFLLCLSSLVLVVQLPKAHRPASGDVIIPYMDSAGLCLPADSLPGGFCSALSIPPNPCHQPFFFFLTHCDLLIFILTNDLLLILERFILLTFYSALSMMGTNGQPVTKAGGRSLCFPIITSQ